MEFQPPKFAHIPLILNPTGGKLSKRHSHTTVDHYIQNDFLPEAVNNFIALLGWRPNEELVLDDMKEIFKITEMMELVIFKLNFNELV